MNITYKKGEIVWAKIQGYSWWPGRITQIKLNLNIKKNRLGKILLEYEKDPIFYITFFPNDSICKIKPKFIKKFIEGYKLRSGEKKRKKLQKAIHMATKAFLKENPDLSLEIKHKIFKLNIFKKDKFGTLKKYLALKEEDEEFNDENDIQSFIDSEGNEIENYKKELKNKKSDIYLNKKRKLEHNDTKEKKHAHIGNKNNSSDDEEYEYEEENDTNENDINNECNSELKKYSESLYRINIEIKRKNNINNIINILDNIENIINDNSFDFDLIITKDLLLILNHYTHYNNEIIMNKSIFLHKIILEKFIENIFSYTQIDSSLNDIDFANINDNIKILGEEITDLIDKLKNKKIKEKKGVRENIKLRLQNKDIKDIDIIALNNEIENIENTNTNNFNIINNKESDEETINNNKYKEEVYYEFNNKIQLNNTEPFLNDILNNPNYFTKKIEGQLYPDNFFKEIYLKSNTNSKAELLRKKMCLQLYNILKLVLPFCQEDIFKKNIIFLEYLARKYDPLFGNKYMTIINMIYNKIKLEAVKIKNKK